MCKDEFVEFLKNFKLFLKGATDFNNKSSSLMKKEADNEMDDFILLCFADYMGIPLSTTYYSLELLPYIANELESWERRMFCKESVWGDRWAQYDFDDP